MNLSKFMWCGFLAGGFFITHVFGSSFEGLGDLPGGNFSSYAWDISEDGSVIIGYSNTASGDQAFRWTKNGGMVSLGNLPDSSFQDSYVGAVSANGSVIVGTGDPGGGWDSYKGYRWTYDTGMELVGCLDGSTHYMALGVSADGSVIVGDGGTQAFRWSQSDGIQGLGVLPGYTNSRAEDISSNGSIIIGSSFSATAGEQAVRWAQAGGIQGLGFLPGGIWSWAMAISPDGSTIGGTSIVSSSSEPGFLWTESTGMTSIGNLPGMTTTHPMGLSMNGEIVVGCSLNGPSVLQAFIWDSVHGIRSLKNVLETDYGLDLTGWTLQAASGITPNGLVIVGWGINPSGQTEAFRAVLYTCVNPPQADLNGDCKVDFQDFAILASEWLDCGLEPPSACN